MEEGEDVILTYCIHRVEDEIYEYISSLGGDGTVSQNIIIQSPFTKRIYP